MEILDPEWLAAWRTSDDSARIIDALLEYFPEDFIEFDPVDLEELHVENLVTL